MAEINKSGSAASKASFIKQQRQSQKKIIIESEQKAFRNKNASRHQFLSSTHTHGHWMAFCPAKFEWSDEPHTVKTASVDGPFVWAFVKATSPQSDTRTMRLMDIFEEIPPLYPTLELSMSLSWRRDFSRADFSSPLLCSCSMVFPVFLLGGFSSSPSLGFAALLTMISQ